MTIWLLSLAGVALAVAAAAALYGVPRPELDIAKARAAYESDQFADRVAGVWLDGRRRVALLLLADEGALGLVLAMGDRTVIRRIDADLLRGMREEGETILLRLDDLALPRVRFVLAGAQDADQAAAGIRARLADFERRRQAERTPAVETTA